MDAHDRKTLCVDVGGTTTKFGLVQGGRVTARDRIESRANLGIGQVLARIVPIARGWGDGSAIDVGFAVPTFVDSRSGQVLRALKDKFDDLEGADVAGWARDRFGGGFRIENDAHAAMLGEWRRGAGQGFENVLMITLGTGIGTSVVLGGRALRGPHAQAGNFGGHYVMDPNGFDCPCGNRGCVEAMQNVNALTRLAQADPRFGESSLSQHDRIDYAPLFAAAPHDALARDLLNRSLDIWGSLVVSLIHQFTPDRVIIGGGVIKSAAIILPRLQSFAAHALIHWRPVDVVAAQLGDDAALIGMASFFDDPPEYI